jgi:SAM-dependent methyltransferase
MSMLSRFFELNRRACRWLGEQFPNFFDAQQDETTYFPEIRSRLEQYTKSGSGARLLEAGGIDRPLVKRGSGYEYVGLDIEERPRCAEIYDDFIVQSVEKEIAGPFDVVFSVTLLEHVNDNDAFSKAVFDALKPGEEAIHYVPNMGHPYALVLRVVGNTVQRKLLALTEGAETKGGYPTHFHRCTPNQMSQALKNAGFTEIDAVIYYSPTKYVLVFVPAFILMATFMQFCRLLGISYFCSGFVISGRRPLH